MSAGRMIGGGRPRAALRFVLLLVLTLSVAATTRADESATVDVTFSTTSAGEFSVTMRAVDNSAPGFGVVPVDADQDVAVSQTFMLDYVDTLTSRGAGDVTISVASFSPETGQPTFAGAEFANFQIPNRYLVLTGVGDIQIVQASVCVPGAIAAYTGDEGMTFDLDSSRRVADVAAGCGMGFVSQPIELTLNVPAGIYPTTYVATVTIESTFD